MSFLLAIEGGDGAGKATAAAEVARQLRERGRSATVLAFPRYDETVAGWAIGEMLAGRLPREVPPAAAAVLYALDRHESRDVLAAAMAAHEMVVLDRYIASNLVYQGAKAAPDAADPLMRWTWELETGAFGLPPPDLSVYLRTPVAVARELIARKHRRSYTDRAYDENEADAALQARVRDGYAALVTAGWAGSWATVTTVAEGELRSPVAIAAEIVAAVEERSLTRLC